MFLFLWKLLCTVCTLIKLLGDLAWCCERSMGAATSILRAAEDRLSWRLMKAFGQSELQVLNKFFVYLVNWSPSICVLWLERYHSFASFVEKLWTSCFTGLNSQLVLGSRQQVSHKECSFLSSGTLLCASTVISFWHCLEVGLNDM